MSCGTSVIGYGDSKRLLLPLSDISGTLDFNINVNADKGKASGWFVSEDRKFDLDVSKERVLIDGKDLGLPQNSIEIARGEIYVDTRLLSKWFPVDFNYDFSTQSISIDPREKLPFQARIEREQAWNNIGGAQMNKTIFPRKNSDYEFFSLPFVDLGVTGSYSDKTKNDDKFKSDFYILSKGDLGKMTSEIYLSGDDKDGLKNTRLTLRRDDPDGKLLGQLKATSVAAGDIRTVNIPIIGGGKTERGVSISNEELHRTRDFDTTFFEGNLAPGWDVEVYRNKILINSKRVGAEGKYSFNEIPIYYGKNDFKLIFYGPQGQERVETKSINVGNDLLKKGDSEYNVSLTQKNTSLYNPDKTSAYLDKDSLKLNATYNYGLNKNLSIGTGISSQEINGEHHDFLNIGAKTNFKGFYLSGDAIHDTKGGNAVELFAQTGIGEIDLRLKQRFYKDFLDDSGAGSSDPLKSQTNISISGIIGENSFLPDLPFTMTYQETKREDVRQRAISSRLAGNINKLSLNNYLQWTDSSSSSSENLSLIDGNLQASTQFGDFRVRGQLNYEIDPKANIKSAEISSDYNITDNLSAELSLKKDLNGDGDFGGSFGLNWNNGKYILSPRVSYNSDDEFSAYLSFSTSFGAEPRSKKIHSSSIQMADKGSASVRVFNDKNNNKVFDKEDELIKGASIKAVQSHREAKTDENGVAFLNMLQKYKPTDIVLDKDTLEDPFWEPSTPGQSIIPRPGHVQKMEIPVVATGEVDGTVLFETSDGKEKPLPNVLIQLLNEKGNVVQQVKSEYDGFYYFSKVFPGNYSIRIDPDKTKTIGIMSDLIEVKIDNKGTIASGRDIFLEKESIALSKPIPVKKQTIVDGKDTFLKKDTIAESAAISLKKEPVEIVRKETQRVPDKQYAAKDIMVREQLQKDYKKLKADYDKIIESKEEYRKINIAKVDPLKRATKEIKILESQGMQKHGLHLSSYRTYEKAVAGIGYLMEKYKNILGESDFTIKKVNVSDEKGIWYRVIAGSFASNETAEKLGKKIKISSPYCKIIPLNNGSDNKTQTGVHLTSFRTQKKALLSIKELKSQYPSLLKNVDFTIKNIDLGPKIGKWKRVVAGRFTQELDAKILVKQLKMKLPYCKTIKIEKDNELGVHMASYRTSRKASDALRQLQKRYHSLVRDEEFSIRRVNLGNKKGVWYRILAGRFSDKNSATFLKDSLNKMNQYANILKFSP